MSDEHEAESREDDPVADHGGWLGDLSRFWPSMSGTRQLVLSGVVLAMFVAGVVLAWRQFGPQIIAGPAYSVRPEDIAVVPAQPAWIKADIKADVIRDGAIKELNLLDPQATVRVAQAFATHSWIKEVRRVSKHHPARIQVEVEYRRPAAMVEVDMAGQKGLLPVDEEGVLLPPDDFSANEAKDYPRIGLGSTTPAGPVGTAWGDARVAGAAQVAAGLRATWKNLELYRICLANDPSGGVPVGEPLFELATRQGVRVAWGHAPGRETPGEATAAQKFARLEQFAKEHGPLEAAAARQIDLRTGQPIKHDARRRAPGLLR